MKTVLITFLGLVFIGDMNTSYASSIKNPFKKKKKEVVEQKKSAYEKLFSSKDEKSSGFITLHRDKGKVYFEVPLSLLHRQMLLGSTVTETSDNRNAIIGSKPTKPLFFCFEKIQNKICLSEVPNDNISEVTDKRMQQALVLSNQNAILHTFDIAAYNADSSAVVFDATDFFVSDNTMLTPFDKYSANLQGGRTRNTTFQKDKSFLGPCKSFKDNLSIRSDLSYTYSLTGGKARSVKDEPFAVKVTRSILLLDSIPVRPRLLDSRIGIFPTVKRLYSGKEQRSKNVFYANRWRLEPSDTVAYRGGKLVEPIKPIVFYIDSCFPDSWKASIMQAVNQWNEPFEKIGFKNAILAKPFPKDDPEFDPDNLKYSCIRYAPIPIENAMGPSWIDPRTGEILNASVYLYHDVIKLLNQWLFVQTSQTDERVRHPLIPNEVMQDAMRYVISHEVGHCLGFMHNMSASAVIPVDSLRSPSYTKQFGTTTSIMDYARFNYVAQPGDRERGVQLMPPHFGPYDYYLIYWNYTPVLDACDEQEEYQTTSKWITEMAVNPIYRYGKQQSEILDPRSQTEDLGDDAVYASQYGVKNLQYILTHLNEWVGAEDPDYSYRQSTYDAILMQYLTYMLHVYHNVGGIYLQEKLVGDPVEVIQSEPKAKQKEALRFYMEQLATLDWVDEPSVLKILPMVGTPSEVVRNVLMKLLMSAPSRVEFAALKAEEKERYTIDECMEDIYQFIWEPTIQGKTLTNSQIKMQNLFIRQLCSTAGVRWSKDSKSLAVEPWQQMKSLHEQLGGDDSAVSLCGDVSELQQLFNPVAGFDEPMAEYFDPKNQDSLCYSYLLRIRNLLNSKKQQGVQATRMHYQLLFHQLDNALNR